MGTRGAYGFQKNGVKKMTYNHWDSYPSGLGKDITLFLANTSVAELNDIFDGLQVVDSSSVPTPEQIAECEEFADTSVSTGNLQEWYVLIRKGQGDLNALKKGLRYMIDYDGYMGAWSYLIDLDDNQFIVYEGGSPEVVYDLDSIPDEWWYDYE